MNKFIKRRLIARFPPIDEVSLDENQISQIKTNYKTVYHHQHQSRDNACYYDNLESSDEYDYDSEETVHDVSILFSDKALFENELFAPTQSRSDWDAEESNSDDEYVFNHSEVNINHFVSATNHSQDQNRNENWLEEPSKQLQTTGLNGVSPPSAKDFQRNTAHVLTKRELICAISSNEGKTTSDPTQKALRRSKTFNNLRHLASSSSSNRTYKAPQSSRTCPNKQFQKQLPLNDKDQYVSQNNIQIFTKVSAIDSQSVRTAGIGNSYLNINSLPLSTLPLNSSQFTNSSSKSRKLAVNVGTVDSTDPKSSDNLNQVSTKLEKSGTIHNQNIKSDSHISNRKMDNISSSASSFYSSSSFLNENIDYDNETNPTNSNSNSNTSLNMANTKISTNNNFNKYEINLESEFVHYAKISEKETPYFIPEVDEIEESSFDYDDVNGEGIDDSFLNEFIYPEDNEEFYDAENTLPEIQPVVSITDSRIITNSNSQKSFNILNFAKQLSSYNEIFQEPLKVETPSSLSLFQNSLRYRSSTHFTEKSVRFGHILDHQTSSVYSSIANSVQPVNTIQDSPEIISSTDKKSSTHSSVPIIEATIAQANTNPVGILKNASPTSIVKPNYIKHVPNDLIFAPPAITELECPPSPTTSEFPQKYLRKGSVFNKASNNFSLNKISSKLKTNLMNSATVANATKLKAVKASNIPSSNTSTKNNAKSVRHTRSNSRTVTTATATGNLIKGKWKNNLISVVTFGRKTHFDGKLRNKTSLARLN